MVSLDALSRLFADLPEVRLAVVFGSAARGSAGADSDIDVGVSFAGGGDEALSPLGVTLERAVGRPVDVVSLDTSSPLLRFEIARDGVLLIEREAHAWADFRARAMTDWWDWAPTARLAHGVMAERVREEAARGSR